VVKNVTDLGIVYEDIEGELQKIRHGIAGHLCSSLHGCNQIIQLECNNIEYCSFSRKVGAFCLNDRFNEGSRLMRGCGAKKEDPG
jgi:hypothetical protein